MRAVISIGHVTNEEMAFIHRAIDDAHERRVNLSVSLHVTDHDNPGQRPITEPKRKTSFPSSRPAI